METGLSQEQEEEDVAVPPVAVAVRAPPVATVPWSPPWCRLNRDDGEASRGRCNGEESGVVTVVGERESQRRTRHVRKETHRGGTVPLPLLSLEFLVAVVVHDVCPALWFLFFRVSELLLHSRISFASIKFPSKIVVAATRVVGDAAAIPVVLE
ncbi:uncharacterized protein DS421_16g543880 [Arachis hypogaea]|nr:uncharacterized protein DS421_16g543880 [Arachis hypogaea]